MVEFKDTKIEKGFWVHPVLLEVRFDTDPQGSDRAGRKYSLTVVLCVRFTTIDVEQLTGEYLEMIY